MISERIFRLSEKVRNTPAEICLDRARLITKFYSEPSMEPFILRRAKSFQYVLENKKIFIDDDSVLAGHLASRLHAVPIYPEVTAWLYDDLETIDTRSSDHFKFIPGEKDELRTIVEAWKGRTFGDLTGALVDADMNTMINIGIFTKGVSNLSTMNHAPAYYDMVHRGYRYYIDKCKENIAALEDMDIDTMEKQITWQSMIIVMEAIIKFAHRYADLAEKMAGECSDSERKAQLLAMAENCRVVPENPPQNFQQAAQFVWFTHLALMMEVNGGDHCIGRFDQYMYPFYKKDLENGVSEAFIADVIHEFKLKFGELWVLRTNRESQAYPGCPLWIHMMIGGVLPDGKDGCNELTNAILHCMDDLQTKEPCVSFRYHDGVNQDTFRLALAVARKGGSHPAFFNDSTNISHLLTLGHTLKEARDWGICGCIEPSVPGITDFQSNAGYFNPIKVFEITMNNGVDPVTKVQIGPRTGDVTTFTSVKQLMDAYETQQAFFMKKFIVLFNRIISCHAHALPTVTASCFTYGCIEKGRILQRKGAEHRYSAVAISGVANVADSLAAIEECVFDKKYLTMSELVKLLETNFEGKENMRQLLINKAPKYGNNIDSVDEYAHWLADLCNEQVVQYRDGRDGQFTTVIASQSYNVVLGRLIGATPDGRLAFTDLADNASPMIGMDVNGPTAVVNSISALDPLIPQSGVLVNQRFDPAITKGEKGLDILETVVRTFFNQRGQHIQVNIVDDETLRAAQKDPQSHRNILVRVAGYSAYFVDLEKDIQDNIIARTLQQTL
ncbi:glycyl radical protein [Pelosinus propionicus]|uniref:Formate C-acetyltransferase n=1 Tax=Pelosinus propionicus DSM 13327 TaxID=1123291 RepID=A0A1I4LTT0_9FIRM|nr:pyruvate formate lyase family protein [Pelosinus propionicus]SFL94410.1 formate C-acetyltransferase [Pelosinus propionicus DSM 13327]